MQDASLATDRKPHMPSPMVTLPMTSRDLNGKILKEKWLLETTNGCNTC